MDNLDELERLMANVNQPTPGLSLAALGRLETALYNAAPSLIATAREVEWLRAEVASGVSLVVELIGLVRLLNNGPDAIPETSFPVIERARQWGLRTERKDDE